MQRALIILITSVYALVSTGIHLHVHLCCGSVKEIGFQLADSACCSKDGDHESSHAGCSKGGCCSNIDLNIQIEDEHQASTTFHFNPLAYSLPVTQLALSLVELCAAVGDVFFATDSGPPLKIPAYILYRALITYA